MQNNDKRAMKGEGENIRVIDARWEATKHVRVAVARGEQHIKEKYN